MALCAVADALRALGDAPRPETARTLAPAAVLASIADILKIHVHTDTPDAVFSYATRRGGVEPTKTDDMRAQHRRPVTATQMPARIGR